MEYNSLAPMLAKCTEEGLALSRYTDDDGRRSRITREMQALQSDWDSVGQWVGQTHTYIYNSFEELLIVITGLI